MRCPTCNARNAEDAAWCTQCFAPLAAGAPEPPPSAPTTTTGAVPAAADPPAAEQQDRAVRLRGEVVEWRCAACGAWTPLDVPNCATCASPRSGFGPAATTLGDPRPRVGVGPALVASALLPGLGHLLRGAVGTGLGRVLLWTMWGGGGAALAASAGVGPGALVLLLAAAALWAVSLVDLQRAAAGDPPVANGRVLAWSVVVVTLLLVVAVLGTTAGRGRT